jgi:dTDP-4-dehydrorhamnose reductase
MLGHRLWINLQKQHETWVTVRSARAPFPDRPEFPRKYVWPNVDGLVIDEVTRAIGSIEPDLVINCVGLIKQLKQADDPFSAISINSMLPHRVALVCRAAKVRMVHISTDCVFSGKKGNYSESDQSDAEDLYGRSKFLGEVAYPHSITLRTSIIGRELHSQFGLIEWFLAQTGKIKGYKRAIYTGFTTDEISNIIADYVIPNPQLSGLYQASSDPISKYDLLCMAKRIFNKSIDILPDEQFACDRSLDSTRFRRAAEYKPPTWETMLEEMHKASPLYDSLRGGR